MYAEYKHHIKRLRDELIDLARRGPVPGVLDLTTELTEMVGTIAGISIARRAKECCDGCTSQEAMGQTANAASNIFRTYMEEAASTTAKRLGYPDPFPNRRRDTEERMMRRATPTAFIDIVFDPNGKVTDSFLQVEDGNGKVVSAGERFTRHDGYPVLRIRPEVFGLEICERPDEPSKFDADNLVKALSGLGIDVKLATNPLEALLFMNGINLPPTTIARLRRAHSHDKMCDCESCLLWWTYAGPDGGIPGDYGPFEKDLVNEKQRELNVEVTP